MQGLRGRFANLDNASKPVFTAGGRNSPEKKEKRQSWWRGLSNTMRSSPTSSPLQPSKSRNDDYAHGAERRIRKRREKERVQVSTRSAPIYVGSDSEAEEQDRRVVSKGARKTSAQQGGQQQDPAPQNDGPAKPHWAFALFEFITQHPTLPHILAFYAQLCLNTFLSGGAIYIIYSFWSTIRSDVDKKSSEAIAELLAEMAVCAQQYTDNRCERSTRVPAMEVVCSNWEKCMNQDPQNVGRARVSAHTFAEIFNSFIEPISYKAMVSVIHLPDLFPLWTRLTPATLQLFTVIIFVGGFAISKFAFNNLADSSQAQHHHYYGNGMPPPPTPHRVMSGGAENGFWMPFQGQQQGLEPAPSYPAGGAQIEGQESPVRRLQFR